ncbi:MAG: hypothetical protein JWQ01_4824 [Massilia sp.]|nr:hypothetical protein [Massilia sp.]
MTALALTLTTHPPKEIVRAAREQHLKDRVAPTPEEWRRQIGWFLEPANKAPECAR